MAVTLQPKAGKMQQPKALIQLDTMLAVSTTAKIQQNQQFGARLRAVLDRKQWPAKKRPEKLRILMATAGVNVTYETCRTWIAGDKSPASAHVGILGRLLGASTDYLQSGQGEMFLSDPGDEELAEIHRTWPLLGAEKRRHLLESLRMAYITESADAQPHLKRKAK